MRFVVFSAEGDPVRMGSCPDVQVEAQAREGETALPWPAENGSPMDWRLEDGELVRT